MTVVLVDAMAAGCDGHRRTPLDATGAPGDGLRRTLLDAGPLSVTGANRDGAP